MSQHEQTIPAGRHRWVGEERRAFPREACYWRVYALAPFPMTAPQKRFVATMRDLSATGVGLLLGQPLDVGNLLIVEVQDPTAKLAVSKIAQVVHVRENPESSRGKRWHAGCEFREPLTEDELRALLS